MEKDKTKTVPVQQIQALKPKLRLVKNSTSFELVIPETVEAKIRHLCSRIHDVEWSGTLFYTVEGSLDDGTFKATCMDICVMDIGTRGFTNFRDTPDIINYRLEHGLLKAGIYEALIHSHNKMTAFFSDTDVNTLLDEGSDMNHFLSLIVCNAGQYVARITRKLNRKIKAEAVITYTETTGYRTFEDVDVIVAEGAQRQDTKVEEKSETIVEYFEMTINKTDVIEPFKELDERLEEIKSNKSRPKPNASQFIRDNKEILAPNQMSLPFDGLEGYDNGYDYSPVYNEARGIAETEDCVEFYQFEKVPNDIVKTLCTQLLTGSILATSKTNLNLYNWVNKMDKLYEARFGSLDDSYNEIRLRNWIESHTDNILCYSVDKKYEDKIAAKYGIGDDYDYNDNDAFIHLYACDMITYLEQLPASNVKNMMIENLISLMPQEYEDFRNN